MRATPSSASPTDRAYADAQAIAHRVAELYTEQEVDRVVLVYNTFVSALTQSVTDLDILPISPDVLETDEQEARDDAMRGDFIFEPEPEEILARLLPVYLETLIYRALLESAASFQGAQMTAMRNASKNARRADRPRHAPDEPCPSGGDHAGDPRGRRRSRSARLTNRASIRLIRATGARLYTPGLPMSTTSKHPDDFTPATVVELAGGGGEYVDSISGRTVSLPGDLEALGELDSTPSPTRSRRSRRVATGSRSGSGSGATGSRSRASSSSSSSSSSPTRARGSPSA